MDGSPNPDPIANPNLNRDRDLNRDSYFNRDLHCDCNRNRDGDRHSYVYTHRDTDPDADSYANADAIDVSGCNGGATKQWLCLPVYCTEHQPPVPEGGLPDHCDRAGCQRLHGRLIANDHWMELS